MKTRILHTKFYKDSFVRSLPPLARWFFVYLLTNEHVNLIHFYECPEEIMAFETGLTLKQIREFKKLLQNAGKVFFYKDYVYIVNAKKYEQYKGVKNEKAKENLIKQLSDDVREFYFKIKEKDKGIDRGIDRGIDTPIDTPHKSEIINHKSEIINQKSENIKEKSLEKKLEYLLNLPSEDLNEFISKFKVKKQDVINKAQDLYDYCQAKGKRYKNYKAFLRNALARDFGRREKPLERNRSKLKVSLDEIYEKYANKQTN